MADSLEWLKNLYEITKIDVVWRVIFGDFLAICQISFLQTVFDSLNPWFNVADFRRLRTT